MKKLILATVACAFLASPALANEFNDIQTKMLEGIVSDMATFKDNAAKIDFLTQKKECTEKATDIDGLKVCAAKFPQKQLEVATK